MRDRMAGEEGIVDCGLWIGDWGFGFTKVNADGSIIDFVRHDCEMKRREKNWS
jgi:hypothetical protein